MNIKVVDSNALLYYHQKLKILLAEKVDKKSGFSLMSDTEIARLASVVNYDDTAVKTSITNLETKVRALEENAYDDTEIRELIQGCLNDIAAIRQAQITAVKVNGAELTKTDNIVDISVPVKTSQLVNDSGYATAADVQSSIQTAVSAAVIYKGTVTAWTDLPTNNKVGDMYNVQNKSDYNRAGDNVVWNGSEWDVQAGTVDLSAYITVNDVITNAQIDSIFEG